MKLLSQSASRRNNFPYPVATVDARNVTLTPGGEVIYRITRRPPATCNAIAALAGLGREVL